jgi:HK97 family phage major capsid protein
MKLFEMKQQLAEHMAVVTAHNAKIDKSEPITGYDQAFAEKARASATDLREKIAASEKTNTLRAQIDPHTGFFNGAGAATPKSDVPTMAGVDSTPFMHNNEPARLSAEYVQAFSEWLGSRGANTMNAALYEGSGSAGGFTVPSVVDGQIVPLAPQDFGVRKLATVMPTAYDIKIPRATTISTAAAKAESGASTNLFASSDFALDQFTLSAFMAGLQHVVSWELLADVPAFQAFCVSDMLLAQSIFEENWYVNGTGTGQAQGLIGNTGAGVTGVLAGSDGYGSELLDATFDVQGTLKGAYHNGAAFLMQRSTGVLLRKAQKQANLFEPVFTRVGTTDYLHGYPVEYSTAMPAVAAGNTPVLFGNFGIGYVIGDRGGSGINVKILDQPLATAGQTILLAYRRTDGRVRRSEAIQAITLHS